MLEGHEIASFGTDELTALAPGYASYAYWVADGRLWGAALVEDAQAATPSSLPVPPPTPTPSDTPPPSG